MRAASRPARLAPQGGFRASLAHEGQADHSHRDCGRDPGTHPSVGSPKHRADLLGQAFPGTAVRSGPSISSLNLPAAGTGQTCPSPGSAGGRGFGKRGWPTRAHSLGVPMTSLKTPVSSGAAPGPHCLQTPPRDCTHPGTAGEAPRPWRWNEKPQGRGHSSVTRPSEKRRGSCANKAGLPPRRVTQG